MWTQEGAELEWTWKKLSRTAENPLNSVNLFKHRATSIPD